MSKFTSYSLILFAIFALTAAAFGQNKYEGYSLTLQADIGGACPVRYLPSSGGGNAVDVFVAGTNQRTPATGIAACDGSSAAGNRVGANDLGRWCFTGDEPLYEIKLRNGDNYLWYPTTEDSGFLNVKDFRPVRRVAGSPAKYEFSEPADYTKTIKNATVYIAARQGGTLRFPEGDYIVGTTDGNSRDPSFQGITLPSGIIVQGAGANMSVPTTNLPFGKTVTRIRLRNSNQSLFRIGGCTNQVTIRDLELLGNTELYGDGKRDITGDIAIEAMGKWTIDPVSRAQSTNSSQLFNFENITVQAFDKGIFVHNANDRNCKASEQVCDSWQFDYVNVSHSLFMNNRTGIWIDTFNTDWTIRNTVFSYAAYLAPGDGIHLQKTGTMLIEQSFGGGYDNASGIGGTFLYIDNVGSLTVVNSAAERGKRSIYTNPAGSITSMMVSVVGSTFGNPVELHGRMNYMSSGSFYGATTIKADPTVTITSTGDRFCYDPLALAGRCTDESGRNVRKPGLGSTKPMFQTGSLPEGRGNDAIDGRPNFFGYNVEIGNGLLQFDPNITFNDITKWASGSEGRPAVQDGALVYCKDCRRGSVCSQGQAGQDGAFAKRINGRWMCD